jgi:preprotein translocase subunit YajC
VQARVAGGIPGSMVLAAASSLPTRAPSASSRHRIWIFMMNELSAYVPIVFAQDANGGSILQTFAMLAPIPLVIYFLFIRPQQQTEQKRRSMLDTLKKNDKVLTTGGMYATVVSVDPGQDKVVLRVDDDRGVKLAFTRASVARILDASSEKATEST